MDNWINLIPLALILTGGILFLISNKMTVVIGSVGPGPPLVLTGPVIGVSIIVVSVTSDRMPECGCFPGQVVHTVNSLQD